MEKSKFMDVQNPFEIKDEAERYQKFRPKYHHIPFSEIRAFIDKNFESALDVACGTGHSTYALSKIANKVIGCDLSETMLAEAKTNYNIEFVLSRAEHLPFDDSHFDFINISMGFHWLDQGAFLKEARRVLKTEGILCIDNYGFLGKISDNEKKQSMHYNFFETYMKPASRRPGYPNKELLDSSQFKEVREINYDHKIWMNSDEFVNLIMTWSNFQIQGNEQKKTTSLKMRETYEAIFDNQKLELGFGGKAVLLRSFAS